MAYTVRHEQTPHEHGTAAGAIGGGERSDTHHYDHIGLLKPSARTAAGYRLYGEADLLRLQQILFFRELDFPLV